MSIIFFGKTNVFGRGLTLSLVLRIWLLKSSILLSTKVYDRRRI